MAAVSEAFYAVLRHHGVKAVFGNPGSNELPFLTGLPDDIPYYLGLQEGAVVAMADGFAQATGTIGFANLHAAAGTGDAMGNMTNTQAGHTPVVVMAGQQARRYVPVGAMLTNVDAIKLARPALVLGPGAEYGGGVPGRRRAGRTRPPPPLDRPQRWHRAAEPHSVRFTTRPGPPALRRRPRAAAGGSSPGAAS